ncbi:Pollen receptor-like kinase 3 [Cocos nucifera]|uniref:Pollen receptor-like kinase 3 n=1 Tax=Cocos nucifera TaxID=13894 RepID=A0A8K0I288_COCNU|nr:Pollen receptor-like kinase 3 [Cocos nucifera]
MAAALSLLPFLLLFLIPPAFSDSPAPELATYSEVNALLLLKQSFTNATALSSWNSGNSSHPCKSEPGWAGVICSREGTIINLNLARIGLSGRVNADALLSLKDLRSLSFDENSLSGTLPPLRQLPALRAAFLSRNQFSGSLPDDFFEGMTHLKRLWLHGNALTGPIPTSLSQAINLQELRLENNHFTGSLPALALPSLSSFNVSNNDIEGEIPTTFSKFNSTSFEGNSRLCGENKPCAAPLVMSASRSSSGKVATACIALFLLACAVAVGTSAMKKNPVGDSDTLGIEHSKIEAGDGGGGGSPRKDYARVMSHQQREPGHNRSESGGGEHRRTGSTTNPGVNGGDAGGGGGAGDLVVVNEGRGVFGLPDLMKAAAEVLGSGGLGSCYKAVMGNGVAVVVKRVRDMNRVGKETFDVEMRQLGRLQHPNLLPPLAYHFRKDEKLLVSEFVTKGSLLYLLHGDRGADHATLDWGTRLGIAEGIARGLAYLHAELKSVDIPHGNLKSANVLLTADFKPVLVDYGFVPLVNPSTASVTLFAYKSPESLLQRHVSPKSDVYCLGVILLELLTGKFPSQYLTNAKGGTDVVLWATSAIAEGREAELLDPAIVAEAKKPVPEMKRLLRVAVECVEPEPDRRPDVGEVTAKIEEVVTAHAAAEAERAPPPSHTAYVRDGVGERSARRVGGVGERSARRSDDSVSFAIS